MTTLAGTLQLTNGSVSVVGTGTNFTQLTTADILLAVVTVADKSFSYLLPIKTVTDDTHLELIKPFLGETASSSTWEALPAEMVFSMPAQIAYDTQYILLSNITRLENYHKLLTVDDDVSIVRPDGSVFTGPSWAKIITSLDGLKGDVQEEVDLIEQTRDQTLAYSQQSQAAASAAQSAANAAQLAQAGALAYANATTLLAARPAVANAIGVDVSTGTQYLWDGSTWTVAGFQLEDPIVAASQLGVTRPADALHFYTTSLAEGVIRNRPMLSSANVVGILTRGMTYRGTAPSLFAYRGFIPLNTGLQATKYKVAFQIGSVTANPTTGTVEIGCAWYTYQGKLMTGTPETLAFNEAVSASNAYDRSFTFGYAGMSGVDIVAPANACYALPFVRYKGTGQYYIHLARLSLLSDSGIVSGASGPIDYSHTPELLFRKGYNGVMYDMSNPATIGDVPLDSDVMTINAVAGDGVPLKATTSAFVAKSAMIKGRYAVTGKNNASRLSRQNLLPNASEWTLVLSHIIDREDRADLLWQNATGAAGRVQITANARYNGAAFVAAAGQLGFFIEGITEGSGPNGQPLQIELKKNTPAVIAVVVKPGSKASQLIYNGKVMDTFTAPPVIYQGQTDIFGPFSTVPSDGQYLQRIFVADKALPDDELKLVSQWVGSPLDVNPYAPTSTGGGSTDPDVPGEPFKAPVIQARACAFYLAPAPAQMSALYEVQPDMLIPPASLTKVMSCVTALRVVDSVKMLMTMKAGEEVAGSGNNLLAGDIITLYDALHNLMLPSSNVTAWLLARCVGEFLNAKEGDTTKDPRTRFVEEMNRNCTRFGMLNTVFKNPHGLAASGQVTTAKDYVRLMMQALELPVLTDIWGKASYSFEVAGSNPRTISIASSIHSISNEEVLGGKTGTLAPDIYNLALHYKMPNGARAIGVVLYSPTTDSRYTDMGAIYEAVRDGYSWPKLLPTINT